MVSAPDAGAGWGPDREAAFQAWEATQNFEKDEVDEEFTFTPQIKSLKGVSSTMGDFMHGWSEKRELHVIESRSERHLLEREELPFQPELPARATNQTLLQGSGYAGPVQAWRKHAQHYKQSREQNTVANIEARKTEGKKMGRQRSWGAVVQRLYPYHSKAPLGDITTEGVLAGSSSPASASKEGKGREGVHKEAGGDASAGGDAPLKSRGQADASGDGTVSPPAPGASKGKPCQRRYGRPPKATWQFLYESGTRKERGKSMPAQAECHETPRPLQRSEQMLQNERCTRRPLWGPESLRPQATMSTGSAAASPTQGEQRSHSVGGSSSLAGQRLFEQSERQRARQEQRKQLANESKIAEEMRECTFRPRTNCDQRVPARSNAAAACSSRTPGGSVDESTLSLYERGVRARLRRQQQAEEGAQEHAAAELSKCTFRPDIRRLGNRSPRDDNEISMLQPMQTDLSPSALAPEEPSMDESFNEAGRSPPSQEVTMAVLTMLDDWRAQPKQHSSPSRSSDDRRPQAMHYSPPARESHQHLCQDTLQQEPECIHSPVKDNSTADMHAQRYDVETSEVQALLQDWRGGWGNGNSAASSLTARPQTEMQAPSPTLPSPGLETAPLSLAPPSLAPPPSLLAMGGAEANLLTMLQRWRAGQHDGMT